MQMRHLPKLGFPSLADIGVRGAFAADENGARQNEIEAARELARREGFARGREEGLAAARQEAQELVAKAREEAVAAGLAEGRETIAKTAAALEAADRRLEEIYSQARQEIEQFAVELAIAVVRDLTSVKLKRQFLARAIQRACDSLKPVAPTTIWLNPSDAKLVADALGTAPIKESAAIAPGAFEVEAGSLFVEGALAEAVNILESQLRERTATITEQGGKEE